LLVHKGVNRHQIPEVVCSAILAWNDVMHVVIRPTALRGRITTIVPLLYECTTFLCAPRNPLRDWHLRKPLTRVRDGLTSSKVEDARGSWQGGPRYGFWLVIPLASSLILSVALTIAIDIAVRIFGQVAYLATGMHGSIIDLLRGQEAKRYGVEGVLNAAL